MIGGPAGTLVLVSAIFAIITQVMQIVLTNRKEMRKVQKQMKEKNQQFRELMKKGENADKKELERIQHEMLELSSQSMKNMPRMMIANMIVFLPLFAWVNGVYDGIKINLFFPLNLVWAQGEWFWVYVLFSILISVFVNRVLSWYEDKKENEKTNPSNVQAVM